MPFDRRCATKRMPSPFLTRAPCTLAVLAVVALVATSVSAVTVTVSGTLAGKTPEIVGYNSGHFMPGSNTADWWRYSGVNGARVWPTPTVVEASDDLAPWGDGVTSQTTFVSRRDCSSRQSAQHDLHQLAVHRRPLPEQSHQRQQHHQSQLRVRPVARSAHRPARRDQLHEQQLSLGRGRHRGRLGRSLGTVAALLRPGVLPGPATSTSIASRCTTSRTATTFPPPNGSSACDSRPTPCRPPSPT